MAFDLPSEDAIQMLLSVTDQAFGRAEAIRRLKAKNNSAEAALMEYFDNPSSTQYREENASWNEDQFGSDRDAFVVQGPDELPASSYSGYMDGAVAPSRPPSRLNNRSPLSNVVDLTTEAALADPATSRPYDVPDDPDGELARALKASLEQSQETGIISTEDKYFGPANRGQYEQGKWDLVPAGKSSAQGIMGDPEPEDRQRVPDAPAFLKPSIANHRVGALLSIYHEIPLMRDMLLDRADAAPKYGYGHDARWWAGDRILLLEESPEEELYHEIQRLMAFLDKTDRSYGSVEPLLSSKLLVKHYRRENSQDMENALISAYREVYEKSAGVIRNIFSRGVDGQEQPSSREFAILHLPMPSIKSYDETIYDLADHILWDESDLSLASPYLSHIGEVIAFHLKSEDDSPKKEMQFPAIWYPDRYMEHGRTAALEMRSRKAKVLADLDKLAALEQKLSLFDTQTFKTIKVKDMIRVARQHDADDVDDNLDTAPNSVSDSTISSTQDKKISNLSASLDRLVKSIDQKLLDLNVEKERAINSLRQLSNLWTENSDASPKLHKYTLRGVSTTKTTMYICRQNQMDLIELDDDSGSQRDQWWKIDYASTVTVERTIEEKVLEAAKSESKEPLLVYASEKAMQWPVMPLPAALETFVLKDNAFFRSERNAGQSESQVSSPGKRKRVASSDGTSEGDNESVQTQSADSSDPAKGSVRVVEREIPDNESDVDSSTLAASSLGSPDRKPHSKPAMVDGRGRAQEMQDRGGRVLSSGSQGGTQPSTIDSMDLDQIMEDAHVADESTAVKHVQFPGL